MRQGLMLLLGLCLTGCGASYTWSKPGGSTLQARQDGFECKQISRQGYIVGAGTFVMGGSEPDFDIWKECLEARGYTVVEQEEEWRRGW